MAPIALFVYRRDRHLARTLDALEACDGFGASRLFVFSDGPKKPEQAAEIEAVRALVRGRNLLNLTLIEAETNQGLARSIIAGVGRLCRDYGRTIVLEDDLILHPAALLWFNAALDRFADDEAVVQVAAYQFRVPEFARREGGMFLRFVNSWGWATWDRAWRGFDPDAAGWEAVETDPKVRRAFDCDDSYPMADMLTAQMRGKLDSWAIRWRWSTFKSGGLTLFPPRSMVSNIGFDETATHNSLGALKRWAAPPPPFEWDRAEPPTLPQRAVVAEPDERAFNRGLRATGAMRNARIKAVLRRLGLWNR